MEVRHKSVRRLTGMELNLNDQDRETIAAMAVATLRTVYGWRGEAPLQVKLHLDW